MTTHEDAAGMVEELLDAAERATPTRRSRYRAAASLIQSQAARIAELEAGLDEALRLLDRYRTETPLGNQPHMIANEVDAFAASTRALLNKEGRG